MVQEGKDPLPCCDMCGMHIPEGRPIQHRKMARFNRSTQMRLRRRDVEITAKCLEATFSLREVDKVECIDGVGRFK